MAGLYNLNFHSALLFERVSKHPFIFHTKKIKPAFQDMNKGCLCNEFTYCKTKGVEEILDRSP